jgi:hypothetical protein
MWFVDIIVNLPWFVERNGKLGEPKSRATQVIPGSAVDNTFLLYGDDHEIRHLRVCLHIDSSEPPDEIVNANIHRWVNLLEVASGITAERTATTASLGPNTLGMMVIVGEGDETADSCQITPQFKPPAPLDYAAAAKMMAMWEPDYRVHLFYLGRFLNRDLPLEVRWLNGYRAMEWHFRRGAVGLSKDPKYRAFLEKHGDALDSILGLSQDRKGLLEEARALAAHAILARTADPKLQDASTNLLNRTFQALETLVIALMNEGTGGRIKFSPKPN